MEPHFPSPRRCWAAVLPGALALLVLAAPLRAADAPTPDAMNAMLHLPFWADDSLWNDDVGAVAERLRWPRESQTDDLASYRAYADGRVAIMGAPVYSMALYGVQGKPVMVSMVFVNKGDYAPFRSNANFDKRGEVKDEVADAFEKAIEKDAMSLYDAIRSVLGKPQKARYGIGRRMKEDVLRWDWGGHAILLSMIESEYVALRIIPSAAADLEGKPAEQVRDTALQAILEKRVVHRDNGDVIISQLPMVDQGPKGYCVPATWERYLWYMGIPADMYVLAMAGNTSPGGGTDYSELADAVRSMVGRHRRKIAMSGDQPRLRTVAKHIDKGFPLMWPMIVDNTLNDEFTSRSRERLGVTDWKQWAQKIEDIADDRKRWKPEGGGHMCLIIGYNEKTGEICISDSWGAAFAERWISETEARALTLDNLMYIQD